MPQNTKSTPTVLITGAARRIGRNLALEMAGWGWQVAVHYRKSATQADQLVDEIKSLGGQATALSGDLSDPTDTASLIPQCCDRLAPPTCLINNASEFLKDTVNDLSCKSWDTHLDINLKAPVFLAQSMFENLPPEAQGNVINIIDQRVWKLTPEFFSYTISKAGLWTATRTLAQAMAPRVRVNAIGPGPVLQSVHQTADDFENEIQGTLLKRGSTPAEIAAAVRFILETPAMTGQMIALDNGQHLTWSEELTHARSHASDAPKH